jgi:hypothetical protein
LPNFSAARQVDHGKVSLLPSENQESAVRGKGDDPERISQPIARSAFVFSGTDVPTVQGVILAPGEERSAIRAEADALNALLRVCELTNVFSRSGIQQVDDLV